MRLNYSAPPSKYSSYQKKSRLKYAPHVTTLKNNPGRWAKVAEFKVHQTAYGMANRYRNRFPGLETACRRLPNGNTGVWFRWPSSTNELTDGS